jgi:eukaryotic-like serine/threonine-protein kinase
VPKAARKKLPVAVLAGGAVVAVIGLLAIVFGWRGSKQDVAVVAPISAASQPASRPAAVAEPAPVVQEAKVAVAAPSIEPAPAVVAPAAPSTRAASVPRKSASSTRRMVSPPIVTATTPGFSSNVPPEALTRDAAVPLRPVPAPVAQAPRPAPPSETCKDKVFLSRQLCLQEECSKPIFQASQACIKFREEARLREDSKVRN